jgi:dienelactone hydrolase
VSTEARPFEVDDRGVRLEPLLVHDPEAGRRPAVLVFPTIMGRSELETGFARRLARLGYAAIVADLYGREHIGKPREKCRALMMALLGDRAFLQARLLAVLEAVRDLPEVDAARVAAIGYCFGGLCALDFARTGADVRGVASFHGLFTPPGNREGTPIKAKVIAFHGWDDPMAPPASVEALGAELTRAGADWQVHAYGRVMHGFTNPAANDPERGLQYNESADRRSWAALGDFLAECLTD